jgi:SAM-dependent methyltransferase
MVAAVQQSRFEPHQSSFRMSESFLERLVCPKCGERLSTSGLGVECLSVDCRSCFPIIDGVPVLINEENSIFRIQDFESHEDTFFKGATSELRRKLRKLAPHLIPDITLHLKAKSNYAKFAEILQAQASNPKVLVVGGSIVGGGMDDFLSIPNISLVESDVAFGPRTTLVCDAHNIPFAENTFDGVIAQGVLEHVIDPYRCVSEVFRVLKSGGIVYAETPFMQAGHFAPYDFTRFTLVGHRRLFRSFEMLYSGAAWGPGMALAWAYKYFLLSFTSSKLARSAINLFAHYTAFWLKYFDYYLIDKPDAIDAASGYYFLGRKSPQDLSDKELIQLYSK